LGNPSALSGSKRYRAAAGANYTPSKSAVVSIYRAPNEFVGWTTRTISTVFFKDLQQ